MKASQTIGQLARDLNMNPKTIRYYEGLGLMPRPHRSESGYRLYSSVEAERLKLIRRAKLLGLSLGDIRELVEYAVDGRCNALERRLLALVETRLGEIDQRIRDLAELRNDLTRYQSDLSARVARLPEPDSRMVHSVPCDCLGEDSQIG